MVIKTLEQRIGDLALASAAAAKQNRNAIGALAGLSTEEKSNLVNALNEVLSKGSAAQAASQAAIGNTASLNTTAKNNLVAALNEVLDKLGKIDLSAVIDDTLTAGTKKTYSIDKTLQLIAQMKTDVMTSISGGITDTTMDTLKEIADFLKGNTAGGLVESLGNRVGVASVQNFSPEQQAQGRSNIGAAAAADLASLSAAIGNPDTDFATAFNNALNA